MDMIFGKRASLEVFPRLHEFFSAASKDDNLRAFAQKRLSFAAARTWFMENCRVQPAHSSHPTTPAPRTGPIISSPRRLADGQVSVRVWLEAEDFRVHPATGVTVSSSSGEVTTIHKPYRQQPPKDTTVCSEIRQFDESALWPEEFWLHDIIFPQTTTGRFRFLINDNSAGSAGDRAANAQADVDWSNMAWFQRVCQGTYADAAQDHQSKLQPLSLLAGSCLYPGLQFDRHGAFSAFTAMRTQLQDNPRTGMRGVDGLILLGDQIYADATADLFDPKSHYERYRNAYRLAFSHPDTAFILSHLPTWLVIDDHEFKDNWRGPLDQTMCYARSMAGLYQMHQHHEWDTRLADLWYNFQCAGYPVFVFDTRSDSHAEDRPVADVLGPRQLAAFENWLISQRQQRVIMLCSGSAIGPVTRESVKFPELLRNEDGLLAFPRFLRKVVELILRHAPHSQVVWLTGDPHLSCVVEHCANLPAGQLRITQICCSGLNAPLPFVNAQAAAYDWDTAFRLLFNDGEGDIEWSGRQYLLTDNPRHFVRLDINDLGQLMVQAYAADGSATGEAYTASLIVTHQ